MLQSTFLTNRHSRRPVYSSCISRFPTVHVPECLRQPHKRDKQLHSPVRATDTVLRKISGRCSVIQRCYSCTGNIVTMSLLVPVMQGNASRTSPNIWRRSGSCPALESIFPLRVCSIAPCSVTTEEMQDCSQGADFL